MPARFPLNARGFRGERTVTAGISVLPPTVEIGSQIAAGNLGAAYTVNVGGATNRQITIVGTLNANCTITFSNRAAGCHITLLLVQDGTGGRTLTISDGSNTALVAVAPDPAATTIVEVDCPNATDIYASPLSGAGGGSLPAAVVTDTSADTTSPVVSASSPRNRALRDFVSVLDYGTYTSGDMTATLQAAIDAASAKGAANVAKFKLLWPPPPPGGTYSTQHLIPKSYVDVHAHGAVLARNPADTSNTAILECFPAISIGSPITHFALRGAVMHGTGTELSAQGLILVRQSTYITVEDCYADNVAAGPIYLGDSQHLHVNRNTLLNCCAVNGTNAINFVTAGQTATVPLKYVWCDGNTVLDCHAVGINVVTANAGRTDPIVDAHITNNTCETASDSNDPPIEVEQGGSAVPGNVQRFDISGNTCVANGNGTDPHGLSLRNVSSPVATDPLCISEVTVAHNRITSLHGAAMRSEASRVNITANTFKSLTDDVVISSPQQPGGGTATIHHVNIVGNTGHEGSGAVVNNLGNVNAGTLVITGNTP